MKKHFAFLLATFLFLSSVSITFAIPKDGIYVNNVKQTYSLDDYSTCKSVPTKIYHTKEQNGKLYTGYLYKNDLCIISGDSLHASYSGWVTYEEVIY
ncbi:hypothetical protein [Longirhabdus pacifica]|uniref:hypothetical protein n=1 Tax=Longirhabdus pacifica TaxID=2305227 RepID=UPI001008FAC5|nr:hypothetical protein [Longirhabdus pacifica]